MNHWWQGDKRFSADNFGYQPTWLIIQALHYGAKLHQEQLHQEELGIATLSALFVNSNRDPKKGEAAKPSDFFYHKPLADEDKISFSACATFFSLVSDEKMPSWAVAIAPVEKLRAGKDSGVVSTIRAFVARGVLLVAPVLEGNRVKVPLALVDGVDGAIACRDIDSGTTYRIVVPNSKGETYWIKDVEFDLLGE